MDAELRPATSLAEDELAALFTAAYEGYVLPMTVTVEALRFLTTAYDLDRAASLVAVRDGKPVGLVNVGLRGPDAWIGGLGVVPAERRRGTGRRLMEAAQREARARGAERVWLEVIVENVQAVALYRDLGYAHVRDVEVWSLAGAGRGRRRVPAGGGARLDPGAPHRARAVAARRCLGRPPGRRPWAGGRRRGGARARRRRTRERPPARGRERRAPGAARGRPARSAIRSRCSTSPTGTLAATALAALGGRVDVRQHELVLEL